MRKIFIGIDPDIDKSGVATMQADGILIDCKKLPELVEYLKQVYNQSIENKDSLLVIIEKGENNKGIFHVSKTKSLAGAIGVNVGKNFAQKHLILVYKFVRGFNLQPASGPAHTVASQRFGYEDERSLK